ncbi:MAG: nucleoside kinase [Eubacterium sp.]|nr:nucleoside kinase [Eubacterium sp.]
MPTPAKNTMKIITLDEINRAARENPEQLIMQSERDYEKNISAAARIVADRFAEKPIVLLSGPSGSGKTTTAHRVGEELGRLGINTLVISMDDYFIPNDLVPKEPDGSIDYEKPQRVDVELLREHLGILSECGTVTLPKFDFTTGTRLVGETITRSADSAVIIEGIHALNPEVAGKCGDIATCLYVSVRTRISGKNGELLHPSKIRLMRRMSRDRLFRGRDISQTIEMFGSVQRGENLYIMPHKGYSDFDIDTFFAYEICIYRRVIEELGGKKGELENGGLFAGLLPGFVSDTVTLSPQLIPDGSVIREFVG